MVVSDITEMLSHEVGGMGEELLLCNALECHLWTLQILGLNLSCVTHQLCDHEQVA